MTIFGNEIKRIETSIYGKTYACYKNSDKDWGTAFLTPSLLDVIQFILL